MNTKRLTALLVTAAMMAGACTGGSESGPTTTVEGARNTPQTIPPVDDDGGAGSNPDGTTGSSNSIPGVLGISLSEGAPADTVDESLEVVDGVALSAADVAAVLDRLPEWDVPVDDVAEFNRPVDSLTPPTATDFVDAAFPPSPDAPTVPSANAAGPLEVLRVQPEGAVDVAPFIAVTFNEPMVELATLDQLDALGDVPVTIEPDIAETAGIDGRWRWIGTRTLRFEVTPEVGADIDNTVAGNGALDRLPAATDYTVTIPAGTESANGAILTGDVVFTFSTPPANAESIGGLNESMQLEPVFVATFDQRVDPESVIDAISLDAGDVSSVRLATADEIESDQGARSTFDWALPGRAVAFVPSSSLDPNTPVTVTVGPGVLSTEGPKAGDSQLSESGRTYPPLAVTESNCGGECVPLSPLVIRFNNPLDVAVFDPEWVSVEPAVPGLIVETTGVTLRLRGATAGNTDYTVTISPDIVDVFGQRLGEEWSDEFRIGDARPVLIGPDRVFVTTDPFAESPGLSFNTINHDDLDVTAWQIDADRYVDFLEYLNDGFDDDGDRVDPDWPVVFDDGVEIDGAQDQLTETVIDLEEAFAASGGPIVLRVQPDPPVNRRNDDYWRNQPSFTFVQNTTTGVDAFVTDTEVLVWVTDLLTGDPIEGAEVLPIGASSNASTTAADGVTRIQLGANSVEGLVVTVGDDVAVLPAGNFNTWSERSRGAEGRWYVVDDRGLYRPGETARITGLVRRIDSEDAQLARFAGDRFVRYTAFDPVGNEIGAGVVPVNSAGGFNLSVEVPEASNTGGAFVELQLLNDEAATTSLFSWSHQFQVQDFRTPDFEVEARTESEGPYVIVEPATIAVDANYFAGGPLGDADVNWFVSATDTFYAPPNWNDFSFGVWTPWWYRSGDEFSDGFSDDDFYGGGFGGNQRFAEFSGRTDAGGTHLLQLDFDEIAATDVADADREIEPVDQPSLVTAEATVIDVNRQAISARTTLLVHPSKLYVGLRSDRGFVERGQPIVIDSAVVDIDGNAVAGNTFDIVAGRLDYRLDGGRYVQELVDEQTCTVTSTDSVTNLVIDESMRCEFDTEVGGRYQITATVTDEDGRSSLAQYTQWVSGGTAAPTRDLTQGEVTIVPSAEFYAPGDTAELLVQAPFAPASGLMTVSRAGTEIVESFDAPDGSAVLTIPIADDDIPNLNVRIDMVGTNERIGDDGEALLDAPPQPAFAAGQIRLQIPPTSRTLEVVATPASANLVPGDSTSVTVSVVDANGAPVADAGVALIVVDEAVLSLTNYQLADPIDFFYSGVGSPLQPVLLRESIILANPDLLGDERFDPPVEEFAADEEAMAEVASADDSADAVASAPEADGRAQSDGGDASGAAISVRENFDALAIFAPDETTDADGSVTVQLDLPDNLTRYRVMAVAAAGDDEFGSGESNITARLPVSVRPSAPRFLNFGDTFELPLVVQNQNDQPVDVDVAIEVANLIIDDGAEPDARSAGRRVTVPANSRVEVRFPVSANEVGTARFRAAVVSGDFADAAEIELPVYTPATAEAFATYGVLDDEDPIAQPLLAPTGVFPQFGGLEISTSSTALQALTDAVLYLSEYRYDSADGYASRIMAVAALRDVLDAFDADGLPDAEALNQMVDRDVEALQALQNGDGGFPSWQRNRESRPWISVHATHALVLAQQNGYAVDQGVLDFALQYLSDIESYFYETHTETVSAAISAYALYVRGVAGDSDPSKALDLYNSRDLQLDSIAQLWTVIDDPATRDEIAGRIENSAVETAGAATFATSYGEDAYVIAHSDRRTDGIILGALVSEDPDNDLIPKVVTGLLGNQVRGRWGNAYENSFILLAMNEYFDTFESVDPDFVARAWLGDTYAAEVDFSGRSTETSVTTVPTQTLIDNGDVDLVLAKDGDGRLYYRLGLRYAPSDLDLEPRDEGFVVERSYEAIDDPSDVVQRPDGTWEVAAGATVRITLTMVADARRTNIALVDPLPAGFEPVNPALATASTVPTGESASSFGGYWWRQWYEHQNLRDDRAEAFTRYLPGGTYTYTYVARATTPGQFVVPPTRAEEIYAPEVFGRSGSDRVVVIDN